jgi:hypothetical protein
MKIDVFFCWISLVVKKNYTIPSPQIDLRPALNSLLLLAEH